MTTIDNKYLFVKKVVEQRRFEYEAFGYQLELVLHFIMRRIAMATFNDDF